MPSLQLHRKIKLIAVGLAIAIGAVLGTRISGDVVRAATPIPAEVRLGAADDGLGVDLVDGQTLVVTLDANPATGYRWEVEDAQARLASGQAIIRLAGETRFEAPPQAQASAGGQFGAPAQQTLRFQAQREGQDTVRLVYRRPWEQGAQPKRQYSFQVRGKGPFSQPNPAPTVAPTVPAAASPTASAASSASPSALSLPASYNWCALGKCTPIKDQGACGSCWAFSTVGPLEANILIHDGVVRDLSEQYLLSGNEEKDVWDCSGGSFAHDYHQWKIPTGEPAAGAVYEADFPYQASRVALNPPHTHHEKISAWQYIGSYNTVPAVSAIKQAILDHGPVSAAVYAGPQFQSYSGGVFQTSEGSGAVNHAIVLTGWDDASGAWILRNSWGAYWGEDGGGGQKGYMRIKYGTSSVGYAANYIVYEGSGDATPPTGRITSPANNAVLTSGSVAIQATASDVGTGVDHVEFQAWYNSTWHSLGNVSAAPYTLTWNYTHITKQTVQLAIDVVDRAGNRTNTAGGSINVTLNHTVIPLTKRAFAPFVMKSFSGD
jgi:predicted secreted protein